MRTLLAPVLALVLFSCTSSGPERLCKRFFTPYPDMLGQRARTAHNGELLDAMALYAKGDFQAAISPLQQVVEKDPRNSMARLYLVSSLLATGDPYKAEMHLDFLENYKDRNYADQVDWYNALCWLCEGNTKRAAVQAKWIAGRPHTYRKEAAELAQALGNP